MCGRFTLAKDHDSLQGRFDFTWAPRYNIAPTQQVFGILRNGEKHAELLHWGLIPSWAQDPSIGSRMINARAETLSEKPSFRRLFRSRRCLVIADGYYEWRKTAGQRRPMRIVMKSGEAFAFAGLADSWQTPDNSIIRSCTIVTTMANELLQTIHDRMPVILPREAEELWMDPKVQDVELLSPLLVPYATQKMDAYPVSTIVNTVWNDSPACIEPMDE